MADFRTIMDRWPSRGAFASDIGATAGAVSNMYARGRIPSRYWAVAILAAARRSIPGVTADALTLAAALKKEIA